MPWVNVLTEEFAEGEYGVYKALNFTLDPLALAYAVGLEYPGDTVSDRLRIGFFYPYVTVENRDLVGPSEEMMLRVGVRLRVLHLLDYGWLGAYPNLASRPSRHGVLVAPDRGLIPSSAQLWRLRD